MPWLRHILNVHRFRLCRPLPPHRGNDLGRARPASFCTSNPHLRDGYSEELLLGSRPPPAAPPDTAGPHSVAGLAAGSASVRGGKVRAAGTPHRPRTDKSGTAGKRRHQTRRGPGTLAAGFPPSLARPGPAPATRARQSGAEPPAAPPPHTPRGEGGAGERRACAQPPPRPVAARLPLLRMRSAASRPGAPPPSRAPRRACAAGAVSLAAGVVFGRTTCVGWWGGAARGRDHWRGWAGPPPRCHGSGRADVSGSLARRAGGSGAAAGRARASAASGRGPAGCRRRASRCAAPEAGGWGAPPRPPPASLPVCRPSPLPPPAPSASRAGALAAGRGRAAGGRRAASSALGSGSAGMLRQWREWGHALRGLVASDAGG